MFLISWFFAKIFKLRTMNYSHLLFRNMNNLAQSLPRRAPDAIILRDMIRAQSGTMGRRLGVPPSPWKSHLTNSPLHTHRPTTPAGVTAPQFPSSDLSPDLLAHLQLSLQMVFFLRRREGRKYFLIWILIYDCLWIYVLGNYPRSLLESQIFYCWPTDPIFDSCKLDQYIQQRIFCKFGAGFDTHASTSANDWKHEMSGHGPAGHNFLCLYWFGAYQLTFTPGGLFSKWAVNRALT